MDEIAARAGITKRALYQHFPSKDDLMAMTLAHSSKLAIERLHAFPRAGEPGAFIDAFFADLSEWAAKPKWSGGGFTRVVVELADLRGHPARAIARNHKTAVEQWLADGLATGGVSSQRERARDHAANRRRHGLDADPRRSQLCANRRARGKTAGAEGIVMSAIGT